MSKATADLAVSASEVKLMPGAGAPKPASRKTSGLSLETQHVKADLANDAELVARRRAAAGP